MKKKIGILTLHSGFNEGAVLQSYCVASNLQNALSEGKVEIVDHRYPGKAIVYGAVRDDRTRTLSDFINHGLPLSEKRFESDDHTKTFDYIRENYDAVVTGSDELWKVSYTRRLLGLVTEQKSPWSPAFPNVYWADESIKVPKIAYAASIGQTDWTQIPRKHRERMRRILSDYRLLGIRDQRTMRFLEWLDPRIAYRAEWVPDPAFSIDILSGVDRASLKAKLERYGVDFSHARVGTVLADMMKTGGTLERLKEKGFQIVSLTIPNKAADVVLFDKGFTPLEWVGIFGFMDFCISQRMHACISSILNDTPFVAVDFYNNPMDDDTKLKHLMRSFNLLDYYFNGLEAESKFENICENLASSSWPRSGVSEKCAQFQARAREFTEKIKKEVHDGG